VALAAESIRARGRFAVALTGGSSPVGLYRLLAAAPYREQVDWDAVLFFFGDERCVPPDHADSNYRMAHETLLARIPAPDEHIFRMAGERCGEPAAEEYASRFARALQGSAAPEGWPRLDLVLLGMGEEGHTASLFPGMPALDETRRAVLWTAIPPGTRPDVSRLTLTLPVLNAARHVMFLVSGAGKAQAAHAVLAELPGPAAPLPAGRVRPSDGSLTWLIDRAASALTPSPGAA
jgi:6-phosphogluconolactonase